MSSDILIAAPIQRIWEHLVTPSCWVEWADVCTEVWGAPRDGSDLKIGSRFGFRLRMAGRNVPFNVRITRFDRDGVIDDIPAGVVEWTSTKFTITADRVISVVEQPDGRSCAVIDRKKFSSPVLPIRLPYPRWLIRNMTESWLQNLKRISESSA